MLTQRQNNDAGIRDEWLPDREVWQFVFDCLEKRFNVDAARMDDRWIPLGIIGTLMWVEVTGWWVIENSGISITGEQFDTAHLHDNDELDPQSLTILRYIEEKAEQFLKNRWDSPGLETDEKGELLGFLKRCVFESSGVPTPPPEILISISWATMVWSLTQKGRNWVQKLSALFDCTVSCGVSYNVRDDDYPSGELLDPQLVENTERGLGVCAKCSCKLWCVKAHCHAGEMTSLCYNCFVEERDMIQYDWVTWDEHASTMCQPKNKQNLDCASCRCPHAIDDAEEHLHEYTLSKMKERGSQRLLSIEESARRMGGVFGRTPQELVDHFRR